MILIQEELKQRDDVGANLTFRNEGSNNSMKQYEREYWRRY
jgi:hypothetical protein